MDIEKLYKEVQSNVIDNCIIISKDEMGVFSAVSHSMAEAFKAIDNSLVSFAINKVVLFYDESANIFTISSKSQCEIFEDFSLQSISFSSSELKLICHIYNRQLDTEGNFILTDCLNSFTVPYDSLHVIDEIKGNMQFGSMEMVLSSVLDSKGKREYYLRESGKIDVGTFISSFFQMFSIPSFLTPDINIKLSKVEAVFAENTNEKERMPNDSFAVQIAIDCTFGIDKVFEISSIEFIFEKFGYEYALGIKGKVKISELTPYIFMARYQEGGTYVFGLRVDDHTEFGFDRIAEMTGVKTESVFPQELAVAKGLKLSNLTLRTNFKTIESFMIEILYDDKWVFCQKPEIALSQIKLNVNIMQNGNSYGISGIITLFGKDISLSANYWESAGWIFRGAIAPYESLSLEEIAGSLAELFEIPNFNIPFDIKVANLLISANLSGEFEFTGLILANASSDDNLTSIFNGKCALSIKRKKINGVSQLTAIIEGSVSICEQKFELKYENDEKKIIYAKFTAKDKDQLSLKSLLEKFGGTQLAEMLPQCFNIGLSQVALSYDYTVGKKLSLQAQLNAFDIDCTLTFGEKLDDYVVNIKINSSIDLAKIPVAGDVLNQIASDTTISGFELCFSKQKGLVFSCNVWGQDVSCVLISPTVALTSSDTELALVNSGKTGSSSTKWITIHKNIGAFHLNRLGIAIKGNELGILVDVSLQLSPLTFDLLGVGISGDIPKFDSVHFVMEGFGVDFRNGTMSISGAFKHSDDKYVGQLEVAVGTLSIVAVGEYSRNSLMVYAVLSYPFGGPPCFMVTGLAAAFGYNKRLKLPEITQVPNYPLVAAAVGKYDKTKLIAELDKHIMNDKGQQFLAAGVKFTSFQVVKGFAMLTVAFGKETEIALLGIADIVMPPNCEKSPIAKAQLALKVAILPSAGLVSCEARLTDESYILSKDCKLTGGFAFYIWFGGVHKGDFVVTLGGYHPSYKKPDHYPEVPRLGFVWDVLPTRNRLVLSGEIYFALTPSAIMAGGKLSAVYSYGNLKAYFIAYADFILQWKPFTYDIRIGVVLGASYRVDFLFIHKTFTVELSADLHLWGPDFSGTAHISWFIISFTIPFGSSTKGKVPNLNWKEFKESFIADQTQMQSDNSNGDGKALSIRVKGEITQDIVRADDFQATIDAVIPFKNARISNKDIILYEKDILIQPMNGTLTHSVMTVKLTKYIEGTKEEKVIEVAHSFSYGNVPSALWGKKDSGKELVENVPIGVSLSLKEYTPRLFPETGEIEEEVLTEAGKLMIKNAFELVEEPASQRYVQTDTIPIFQQTAERVSVAGKELLHTLGFDRAVSLSRYAKEADTLFDDDMLIGSVVK